MSTTAGRTHNIPEPTKDFKPDAGFYTAQILVPVTLPAERTFVPTFHSCLISRVYTLNLHLGIHSVGVVPSVELKIPIQVSAQGRAVGRAEHRGSLTAEEEAVEEREADDFFDPRTISPIMQELQGQSNLGGLPVQEDMDLPPDYDAFSRTNLTVPVH